MAANHKILVLGKTASGKKQVINGLLGHDFSEKLDPIIGVQDFSFRRKNQKNQTETYPIWAVGGAERFKPIGLGFYKNTALLLYCVALDEEADIETIKYDIEQFKAICPEAKIVLVGTKFDLVSSEEEARRRINPIFDVLRDSVEISFITSAKNNESITQDTILELLPEDPLQAIETTPLLIPSPDSPGFLKKHMEIILKSTLAGAGAGAIVGAGVGVGLGIGMSITGTIPTFGLSILLSHWAIPIMSASLAVAGALVGAMIGLVVGLSIAAYREHQENQYGFFGRTNVPDYFSDNEISDTPHPVGP